MRAAGVKNAGGGADAGAGGLWDGATGAGGPQEAFPTSSAQLWEQQSEQMRRRAAG